MAIAETKLDNISSAQSVSLERVSKSSVTCLLLQTEPKVFTPENFDHRGPAIFEASSRTLAMFIAAFVSFVTSEGASTVFQLQEKPIPEPLTITAVVSVTIVTGFAAGFYLKDIVNRRRFHQK